MRALAVLPASLLVTLALAPACATDPGSGGSGGAPSTTTSSSSTATSASSSTGSSSSAASSSSTGSSSGAGGMGTGGAGPASFALLSLNLHCLKLDGTAFATNAERFAAVAALAAARGVAVLTVQEACKTSAEDAIAALRSALESATGTPWSSSWALAHVAWQGTPDEANEGVGLLVRGALSSEGVLDHAKQGSLRRVAVSATLPPELSGARVTSVHLDVFDEPTRASQAREAANAALADTDPGFAALVAGDFNDVEASATVAAFPGMGYLDATKGLDATGIDHVMVHRAAPLRPVSAEEVFLGAAAVSDHPGILVQLAPASGDVVTATRVKALFDPGAGHYLAVRGDQAPLSWSAGFPMRRKASAEQVFVSTELAGPFAFKALVDDSGWQTGGNVAGTAGQESVFTPSF
jgi:endonuclease/exonuclease/phosphatase family metal-dependent hydrolase